MGGGDNMRVEAEKKKNRASIFDMLLRFDRPTLAASLSSLPNVLICNFLSLRLVVTGV